MGTCLHHNIRHFFWVAICLATCLMMACTGTEVGNPDNIKLSLSGDMTAFSSDAELEAYLKEQYRKSVFSDFPYDLETNFNINDIHDEDASGWGTGDSGWTSDQGGGGGAGGTGGGGDSGYDGGSSGDIGGDSGDAPSASDSYTGTNLQETGVDEADVVKTDGTYLYVAGAGYVFTADTVTIVHAADPMTLVGTVQINGSVDDMYLYGNLLVVLYTPTNYQGEGWVDSGRAGSDFIGIPYWIPIRSKTGVAIFDVMDPAAPVELKTIEADGYQVSSRRIENKLHVVQQYLPVLPQPDVLKDDIGDMTMAELIPFYEDVTHGRDGERLPIASAENFYAPEIDGGGSIVTIMTFDLDDIHQPFASVAAVADASIVYASTQALYCTATYWTGNRDASAEQTVVYRFDISGDQVTSQGYIGVGGRVLNQFSLGEYENVLRIATTTGSGRRAKNHVYCVGMQDGKLKIIGSLQDLAPGETIYAARFIGPRGYLVTYVQVDPLFTLDLSDPSAPKVAGELKVPGYSDYIHPWGQDHLITIGKDTLEPDGSAWYQGVQLSIFDISDFSDPQLLHNLVIGNRGTESEALSNHKAFTFWEEQGLLAIPIELYEHESPPARDSQRGTYQYRGLFVYRVSIENGFEALGNIVMSDKPYWVRGIFMDETVYAVEPDTVRRAQTDDIAGSVQSIDLYEGLNIAGVYDTPGTAESLFIAGSHAYVADGDAGLQVVDISDPGSPFLAGSCDTPGSANGITISGNFAHVADGVPGLQVVDISDPGDPFLTGGCNTPGTAYGITVSGSYAYVADGVNGLQVIDISDPEEPFIAGACDTPGTAYAVAVSGNYAYVADGNALRNPTYPIYGVNDAYNDQSLQVIDISDPTEPFVVGRCNTPGKAYGIGVAGSYAYVADDYSGLLAIDISTPANPSIADRYQMPFRISDVSVSGNYAYTGVDGVGLVVIDIADPENLLFAAFCITPDDVSDVFISGTYAYAATGSAGLQVIQLSE